MRNALKENTAENVSVVADIHTAWGIIANVSNGDWTRQSETWQQAAKNWRDLVFHSKYCSIEEGKEMAYSELIDEKKRGKGDTFNSVLDELSELHDRKGKDYDHGKPYKNIRNSEEFGVDPWVFAMLRANEKMKRIQKYAVVGELSNESVEDSFLDLCVCTIIALILYRESQ